MKSPFNILASVKALDFIRVYEPVSQLRSADFMLDFSWDLCSFTFEADDDKELQFAADQVKESLSNYDAIVVIGKFSSREKQKETGLSQWLEIFNIRQKNSVGVYRFAVNYQI